MVKKILMAGAKETFDFSLWVYRGLKKIPVIGSWAINKKLRYHLPFLQSIHFKMAHSLRDIGPLLHKNGLKHETTLKALDILAEKLSCILADFLVISSDLIDCTIKLCGDKDEQQRIPVTTIARSENIIRPLGTCCGHYHSANSAFASAYGISDGATVWTAPYPIFCCNDLSKRASFKCTREGWAGYFSSTMVMPLRLIKKRGDDQVVIIFGFLTFSSREKNVFRGVPETYDYISAEKWGKYQGEIADSPLVNLCGILADTLTAFAYAHLDGQESGG